MDIRVISKYEEFLGLEPVWNGLLSKSDMDNPFMTFEWFKMWWGLFGAGAEMMIYVVSEGGETGAIVPLMRERASFRGLPVTLIKFMTNYYSVSAGMISRLSGGVLKAVLNDIRERGAAYDIICLDQITSGSATDNEVREAAGTRCRAMEGETSPYIRVGGSWDEYVRGRPKKLRANMKRKEAAILEAGGCEAVMYSDEAGGRPLREMFEISRNSWKHPKKAGVAGTPENARFHEALIPMMSKAGWLNLWILYHKGAPAAFSLNMEYRNRIYANQIGYDQRLAHISPGFVLFMKALKDGFDRRVSEFHMLGSEERWKLELAEDARGHTKYFIFGDTPKGKLLRMLECGLIPALNRIWKK